MSTQIIKYAEEKEGLNTAVLFNANRITLLWPKRPQVALLGIFAPARSLPGPVGRLEVAESILDTGPKGWQSFSFMKEFPDESWWHSRVLVRRLED